MAISGSRKPTSSEDCQLLNGQIQASIATTIVCKLASPQALQARLRAYGKGVHPQRALHPLSAEAWSGGRRGIAKSHTAVGAFALR